jgi:hypothetical protein
LSVKEKVLACTILMALIERISLPISWRNMEGEHIPVKTVHAMEYFAAHIEGRLV